MSSVAHLFWQISRRIISGKHLIWGLCILNTRVSRCISTPSCHSSSPEMMPAITIGRFIDCRSVPDRMQLPVDHSDKVEWFRTLMSEQVGKSHDIPFGGQEGIREGMSQVLGDTFTFAKPHTFSQYAESHLQSAGLFLGEYQPSRASAVDEVLSQFRFASPVILSRRTQSHAVDSHGPRCWSDDHC